MLVALWVLLVGASITFGVVIAIHIRFRNQQRRVMLDAMADLSRRWDETQRGVGEDLLPAILRAGRLFTEYGRALGDKERF